MAGNLVHINLLGTRFSIETDEKPEYLQSLIENLDKRLSQLGSSTGLQNPLKLSLLAGILLEDELLKCMKSRNRQESIGPEKTEDFKEAERLTLHILKKIDKTLQE
ncbi:MAG: cell division protein ZapA [Spirochaetales bacterium]|nr:cell division protein ZapA [Spirochaetales bacterium]